MEQKPGEYARIVVSREEYEQFKSQQARISELEQQVTALREALRLAQHKRFGASSEKTVDDGSQQLSFLFNEAEVIADQEAAQDKQETLVAAHKRHKKHEYTLDNLPDGVATEVVEHRVPQEELECPICGETMQDIGKEVVRKLKIIPAQVIVVEHRYYAYACRNCDQNDIETPVTTAEREKSVIRGSFATAEALAHIMVQKFVMGSPLYRQEQEMKRQGIPLSRQTMSNWILRAAADYLTPVYDALHRELLRREVLHADETTLQVLHEPGKKPQSESYMWLYRTGGLSVADSGNSDASERPIVLYEYQPGRGAKHPTAFLEGFRGYLHTDGYAGYHSLSEEIVVVGCWAHARRKFDEALKSLPKGKAKNSAAWQGLDYCNQLFAIEQELADKPATTRYEERRKRAKPILDAMLAWANSRTAAPNSALGKALHYLKEQWPYLVNYLKDGRLEISNNRAERSIKPFVIDRKNFLFANTQGGAQGSAVIFSLIQTAIENGLDPWRYLTWLIDTAAKRGVDAEGLLPWVAPDSCRVSA